ncbi:MAG: hypothetical protein ACLRPT_08735 [Akkermansia muciniphila]
MVQEQRDDYNNIIFEDRYRPAGNMDFPVGKTDGQELCACEGNERVEPASELARQSGNDRHS